MISRRTTAQVALAALTLGFLAAAHPARAQFPTSLGETGAGRRVITVNGKQVFVPTRNTYLSLSPYTLFQFKNTVGPDSMGHFETKKTSDIGPFVQIEKRYPLFDNPGRQPSSFTLGAWYWYHKGGAVDNPDRFGVYGQYSYSRTLSVQVTLGGATRGAPSGFFEYYGFLLYQPSLPRTSRMGFQFGAGPYVPRHNVGNVGYTYTVGGVYRLSPIYSLSASYWKVNYNKPAGTFGTNVPNDLARTNISLVYNFK